MQDNYCTLNLHCQDGPILIIVNRIPSYNRVAADGNVGP